MLDSFYIAWKYVSFNKIKTATLVACITLISFLPISLQLLLDESERQLMSRAVSTPLVIGVKGSSLLWRRSAGTDYHGGLRPGDGN
jgi:putative ABC transport system permease protein